MNRKSFFTILVFVSFSSFFSFAQTHKGISFQGVIKLPNGEYPTRSGLTVNARILSPNNCILREEQFSGVNLSNGYLNIAIGTGATGGHDPGLTLSQVMNNSATIASGPTKPAGLTCLNIDGSINGSVTSYDPSTGNGARKFRLSLYVDAIPVVADFNMRAMAFALNSETLEGKTKNEFIQTSAAVTQGRLEQFITNITAATGNSIKWDGSSFVAYNPNDGSNLTSIPDSAISNLNYSKLTSVPTNLSEIAGLSCVDGKILKKVSGAWACADESGSGAESDPTVQTFAKNNPGAGLTVVSNQIAANIGTTSGTLAAGDDARFSDARTPTGSAGGDLGGTYPNPSVVKIQNRDIDSSAPNDGQVLLWDNSNSTWRPQYVRMQDVRNQWGGSQMYPGVACTSNQAMVWSAITDQFSCQNVTGLAASDITSGVLSAARLGTGTANASSYLAGDGTWKTLPAPGTGDVINGGNSTAGELVLGTNTAFNLQLKVNNVRSATLYSNGFIVGSQASGNAGLHAKVSGAVQGTFESTDTAGGIQIINSTGTAYEMTTTSSSAMYPNYLSIRRNATGYLDGILMNTSNRVSIGAEPSDAKFHLGADMTLGEMSAPVVSSSSTAKLYFDTATKKLKLSEGGASFQDLVPDSIPAAKVTGLAASATSDTTNASNITSGTINAARLPSSVTNTVWTANGSDIYKTGGNVGIGLNNPSQALDVNGTIKALELMGAWDTSGANYIRLGDLQVSWGVSSVIADGATESITFPAAYSQVPIVVVSSTYRSLHTCSTGSSAVDSRTTTGFTMYVEMGNNNKCNWVAIGRWR